MKEISELNNYNSDYNIQNDEIHGNVNTKKYQETGNKIPIALTEFINYVQQILNEYDELLKATGTSPDFNPYTETLIYKTKDGKIVQIPEEIKKIAINDRKKNEACENGICSIKNKKIDLVNEIEDKGTTPPEIVIIKEKNNKIYYLILIIIILAFIYYINKK